MRIFPRQPQHGQVSTPGLSRSMYSLKIIFSGLFSRVSLQLIRFFRIITMHCETMTPLVRAMTLFGHGGAWRKNFGLPGRWGSSSSFIVCRKDYSGSRVFPQVKKTCRRKRHAPGDRKQKLSNQFAANLRSEGNSVRGGTTNVSKLIENHKQVKFVKQHQI